MITREGSWSLALRWRRGVNLLVCFVSYVRVGMSKKGFKNGVLLNSIKDTLHVQIHHFRKRLFGMCLEFLTPCCACVCKEDIDMVCCFRNFSD